MYQIIAFRSGVSFKHYPTLFAIGDRKINSALATIKRNWQHDPSVRVMAIKVK
jgi:hypothetical protein